MGILAGLKKVIGLGKKGYIERPLTHGERVFNAREVSKKALGMFQEAHDKLEEANEELTSVKNEANEKVADILQELNEKVVNLQRHIKNADFEINVNKTVQEQLKPFIANK